MTFSQLCPCKLCECVCVFKSFFVLVLVFMIVIVPNAMGQASDL